MTIALYAVTAILLGVSFYKDRKKSMKALKKAWKAFENIMPQLLGVIVLVGMILAIFDAEFVSKMIGEESGIFGVLLAGLIGAITLIPGFVAFPTAALVLNNGGGYMQVAVFVSTLMMVGVVTLPVEIKYFGKKLTYGRNILAFLSCFVIALIVGKVASGVWF